MLLLLLSVLVSTATGAEAAAQFSPVKVMGRVHTTAVDENSGLAASRLHEGVLYGHNDHGDKNRLYAMDPASGNLLATFTIDGIRNQDWEDLCVGTCGQGESGTCIYIRETGEGNGNDPLKVFKVREPAHFHDDTLHVLDTYTFEWEEDDAESLLIDPNGELYVISKVHGGNSLFAQLPSSGWGSRRTVTIGRHNATRLHLHTDHNDPQGADLSPDGRRLLVKTEDDVLYYEFSSRRDYVNELAFLRPQVVSTYVRRESGESVAWNVEGTGFYTLPEGDHPVFHFYAVSGGTEGIVG